MVVGTATPAGQDPNFQKVVAGAHLQRGHAAPVVVSVHQARDDGDVGTAQFGVGSVALPQVLIGADVPDDAVFLVDGRIADGRHTAGALRTDEVFAADQRGGHGSPRQSVWDWYQSMISEPVAAQTPPCSIM